MASSGADRRPLADRVEVGDAALRVWFREGRTLTVPLHWLPRLADAPEHERNEWRTAGGATIFWPGLGMTVAVDDLLADSPPYPACPDEYARAADVKVTDRYVGVWLRDGVTVENGLWPQRVNATADRRNMADQPRGRPGLGPLPAARGRTQQAARPGPEIGI